MVEDADENEDEDEEQDTAAEHGLTRVTRRPLAFLPRTQLPASPSAACLRADDWGGSGLVTGAAPTDQHRHRPQSASPYRYCLTYHPRPPITARTFPISPTVLHSLSLIRSQSLLPEPFSFGTTVQPARGHSSCSSPPPLAPSPYLISLKLLPSRGSYNAWPASRRARKTFKYQLCFRVVLSSSSRTSAAP